MCGRARCTLRVDDVPRACHRSSGGPSCTVDMDRYRPSYNVSPGFNVPVIRRHNDGSDGDGYALHCMRWGLIPSFTKKTEKPDFYKMFNARSESVGEKASFRRLLPKNRCLVAVEGFYEWKKDGSKRQPYYIHFKDGRPLVFAALYDSWKNSEGEMFYTFTILTTSSSPALQWLHDRMPVILGDKGATDAWLDDSSSSKFNMLFKPYEDVDLVWYPVTTAMGKPSFDGPECVKEIQLKTEEKGTISKFFSKVVKKEEKESDPEEGNVKSIQKDPPKSVKKELEDQEEELPGSVKPKDRKEERETGSKMDMWRSAKEEDVNENKQETASDSNTLDDLNPGITALPHLDDTVDTTKPESERFLVDAELNANENVKASPELNTDENSKLLKIPARKKAKVKSGNDKQPTLLSYFGKR